MFQVNVDDFKNIGFTYCDLSQRVPDRFDKFTYTNATNGSATVIDPNADRLMRKLQRIVTEWVIRPHYKDVQQIGYDMWQGVPPDLKYFHNDFTDHKKSHNSNVFIFIDECSGDNMNFLEVRAGLDEFYQVIPNKHDLIWLNQSEHFTYKMIHKTGKNRILNFRYYINGLDNQTN